MEKDIYIVFNEGFSILHKSDNQLLDLSCKLHEKFKNEKGGRVAGHVVPNMIILKKNFYKY